MSDETKPQDSAAMSPASAGSHGPVSVSVHIDDSACAFPDSRPLRRPQPTLTDEELKAIRRAAAVADEMHDSRLKAALGGLMERLG
jgi:Xaa-Pro aminopeptidase